MIQFFTLNPVIDPSLIPLSVKKFIEQIAWCAFLQISLYIFPTKKINNQSIKQSVAVIRNNKITIPQYQG